MNHPREQITGQVAAVEDEFTLVINRGHNYSVAPGMIFAIFEPDGANYPDPETGESLGPIPQEKLRVKVFDVYPKACRAKTYRVVSPLTRSFVETKGFRAAGLIGGRDLIRSSDMKSTSVPMSQQVITVNIGDIAKEVGRDEVGN